MKLEESVRASVAKASYRKHVEKTLGETFALHEENLEFAVVDNSQRGFTVGKGVKKKLSKEILDPN